MEKLSSGREGIVPATQANKRAIVCPPVCVGDVDGFLPGKRLGTGATDKQPNEAEE
ncbi:MAG: hypothetical protein AAF206_20135 [Bacteroidota bacterium]